MRVHNKPSPDSVEKSSCHICERVFKSKTLLDKHVSKHVETTAEEYKTKKKAAEKRRALKRAKQQQQQEENAEQDNETGNLESDPSGGSAKSSIGVKRKQRKPNRVVYNNEDESIDNLNTTEYMSTPRDRLDGGHSCTYCNETFSSISLLNSHIKLHIRDKIVLVPEMKPQQHQPTTTSDIEDSHQQSTDDQNNITIDTAMDENTPSTSATQEEQDDNETDATKSNKLVAAILNQINSQLDSESAKGLVLDVATEAGSLQITSISVQEDVGNNLEIEFPKDDE